MSNDECYKFSSRLNRTLFTDAFNNEMTDTQGMKGTLWSTLAEQERDGHLEIIIRV